MRVDLNILGGSPYVEGSRVPVRRLWAFYEDGIKVETILKRFPQLEAASVFDALAFALDNLTVVEADLQAEKDALKRANLRQPAKPKGSDAQMDLPFAGSRGRR